VYIYGSYRKNKIGVPFLLDHPVYRIINVWNSLPHSVSFKSLRSFKHTIKNVDLSKFLKCF